MKANLYSLLAILLASGSLGAGSFFAMNEGGSWTNLIDKDLSQWDRYLSYQHKDGYNGDQPVDEEGKPIPPIGLNRDDEGVFTVVEEDNELLLRISGEIYGCVFTKQEYENYHLQMKVKWGDKKWTPRKDMLRDTGILYHGIGEPGVEHWRSWMLSHEFQIMEGRVGDYWGQLTAAMDIRAYPPEYIMNPIACETQPFIALGEAIEGYCLRSENFESPAGEWTKIDLFCFEGKSVHMVNDHVVMVLKNSRYKDGDEMRPLTKGKIQLQSEAAEVFFKEIRIKAIESLPAELAKHY